jgi:2-methylcitrate dehydratase PrpD
MSIAAQSLAKFVRRMETLSMSDDLAKAVGRVVLDTFAVGIAGTTEPAAVRAFEYLRAVGQDQPGSGLNATFWGRGGTAPVEQVALYNGIAAHVLDYDDVTSPLRGHPSVAMLPALIAVGEAIGASGEDLIRGYVAGFEVVCALARCMGINH